MTNSHFDFVLRCRWNSDIDNQLQPTFHFFPYFNIGFYSSAPVLFAHANQIFILLFLHIYSVRPSEETTVAVFFYIVVDGTNVASGGLVGGISLIGSVNAEDKGYVCDVNNTAGLVNSRTTTIHAPLNNRADNHVQMNIPLVQLELKDQDVYHVAFNDEDDANHFPYRKKDVFI